MNIQLVRPICFLSFFLVASLSRGADDASKVGFVDCSSGDKHRLTPIFSDPCVEQPVGNMACGETVTVIAREGPWFKIASEDGSARYISAPAVSREKERFVGLDIAAPPGPYIKDCSAFRPKTGKVKAVAIYRPDPEYTKKARKAKISGTVVLSLTIGIDGRAHDITIVKRLGYGLDEQALESVKSWRFEPALDEGVPVVSKVNVEVSFRLY